MREYEYSRYNDEHLQEVVNLLLEFRLATSVRAYPTLWRLELLLSSRVWNREEDAALWRSESGEIVAFGMLWRRRYDDTNLILEYCVDPVLTDASLLDELLAWSKKRASEISRELAQSVRMYAGEHSLTTLGQPDFSGGGLTRSEVDPQRYTVFYQRSLTGSIDPLRAPSGFSLKLLDAGSDIEAYDHLYSFTNVNSDFRQKLLASDEYAHLVLADSEGKLVSFCEYSISKAEWERGAERLGWIDYVGTHDDHQGQGLGTIVLTTALSNLKESGAETAILATVSDNFPAIRLYKKSGFMQAKNNIPIRFWCELQA